MATPFESIPGVSAPLRRALEDAGFPDLESLDGVDYASLISLHGVGKRGLERLNEALKDKGMSLSGDIPLLPARTLTMTNKHTGVTSDDIKTRPTEISPAEYIEQLEAPRRVTHGRLLLDMFDRVTGAKPVMWGPSMIGYGETHFVYDNGREGDWFRVGFSPRKAKLSLYGLFDGDGAEELLTKLGTFSRGRGCLYVNKPEDIDLGVVEELIRRAWVKGND